MKHNSITKQQQQKVKDDFNYLKSRPKSELIFSIVLLILAVYILYKFIEWGIS